MVVIWAAVAQGVVTGSLIVLTLRESQWILPNAGRQGFNAFNRYWARQSGLRWRDALLGLDLISLFLLAALRFLHSDRNSALLLLILAGTFPWLNRYLVAAPYLRRLRLAYQRQAFFTCLRLERTNALLWLLKGCVLLLIAASL